MMFNYRCVYVFSAGVKRIATPQLQCKIVNMPTYNGPCPSIAVFTCFKTLLKIMHPPANTQHRLLLPPHMNDKVVLSAAAVGLAGQQWQRLAAALLGVPVVVGRGRPMDQEGGTLGLPDGVEPTNPDVGVGEGLGGIADLSQDLAGIIASEHGQLVHGPVPSRNTRCQKTALSGTSSSHNLSSCKHRLI